MSLVTFWTEILNIYSASLGSAVLTMGPVEVI